MQGPVRCCSLCYVQLTEKEFKPSPRITPISLNAENNTIVAISKPATNNESLSMKMHHTNNLQKRASLHMERIVEQLVNLSVQIEDKTLWKNTIVNLVREVVSSVDPNVRKGDNIDIRQYVKLKIIPGGSMSENAYIDGIVFRKNVSHKKMGTGSKMNPRILLLSGGIEFQRMDHKLSSMFTLLEQEDKYMELLVEKIMSLKPDIVFVGKAISRRAQELLCQYDVVVMQNVKSQVLERISRLTGAVMLPSTDHMIQHFGTECLGTCGKFWLRIVADNPEKMDMRKASPNRILAQNGPSRGSTYAYLQGCPADLGCTLLLRGADRSVLAEVKKITSFSISLAYHLRLEVAYYNDRCAQLPEESAFALYDDDSDCDGDEADAFAASHALPSLYSSPDGHDHELLKPFEPPVRPKKVQLSEAAAAQCIDMYLKRNRLLFSTSLDVDVGLPSSDCVRGLKKPEDETTQYTNGQYFSKELLQAANIHEYQSILVTSLLMGREDHSQRCKVEVKGIRFYSSQGGQDISLGKFLIDNCFSFHQQPLIANKDKDRDVGILDNTLCFSHRKGRVEINVLRVEEDEAPPDDAASPSLRDPNYYPIRMSSYCNICHAIVATDTVMSDETWKMSLGKFLEITFYNRSACGRALGCNHCIRDHHRFSFLCKGLEAQFTFIPQHYYSLHVRQKLEFPQSFHASQGIYMLSQVPFNTTELGEKFRKSIEKLRNVAKDNICSNRHDDLLLVQSELQELENDVDLTIKIICEDVPRAVSYLCEGMVSSDGPLEEPLQEIAETSKDGPLQDERLSFGANARCKSSYLFDFHLVRVPNDDPRHTLPSEESKEVQATDVQAMYLPRITLHYPAHFKRAVLLRARQWNARIEVIERIIEDSLRLPSAESHNLSSITSHSNKVEHFNILARLTTESSITIEQQEQTKIAKVAFTDADNSIRHSLEAESVDDMSTTPTEDTSLISRQLSKHTDTEGEGQVRRVHRNSRRIDKITNFFLGGNAQGTAKETCQVPLTGFATGRLTMRVGRRGEAIGVHEDELSTVIAYSLASNDYYNELQKFYDDEDEYEADSTGPVNVEQFSQKTSKYSASDHHEHPDHSFGDSISEKVPTIDIATPPRNTSQKNLRTIEEDSWNDEAEDSRKVTISPRNIEQANASDPNFLVDIEEGFNADNGNGYMDSFFPLDNADADGEAKEQPVPLKRKSRRSQVTRTNIVLSPIFPEMGESDLHQNIETPPSALPYSGSDQQPTNTSNRRSSFSQAQPNLFEKHITSQRKLHIRTVFQDTDDRGAITCKFFCTSYWAGQFEGIRALYMKDDFNSGFIRSLSMCNTWVAQGGKSGAHFSKTLDDRFIVKCISRVELQMFLDFAPAYFEYIFKAHYHNLPTVLAKVLGVYTVGTHNKDNGKKTMENIIVMENIFYQRHITRVFDLKGTSRSRRVDILGGKETFDEALMARRQLRKEVKTSEIFEQRKFRDSKVQATDLSPQVLLDDNLMELTNGRPFPLKHKAKIYFHKAVINDTLFLSIINVVDYSILVGFDEQSHEVVVGIIDYMRQYDFAKKMERMGKSVGMLTGQAEPTIIQPSQYRKRFTLAMERYFMTVPDKWNGFNKSSKSGTAKDMKE